MTYYTVMRGIQNIFNLRIEMVQFALEKGISASARQYNTTRRTVTKWVNRYKKEGLKGLQNHSRAPKHIPHKTPKQVEERIIELRKTHPAWGPERLKMHYDLPVSTKAIGRIIRQAGLVKKKKKKYKKQRDLREIKKQLRALQMIEIDTKDLSDIEKYWPQMKWKKLPRYQFTARDVRTGGTFYAYSHTKEGTSAAIFARYLFEHLKSYGIDMTEIIIQTDNGSEFIGSVMKKKGRSAFIRVMEAYKVKYARIPPRACTWQSDVEVFHKMIEDEFYDLEDYKDINEFSAKAYAYQIYFNFKRKNRWRDRKSPCGILKEIDEKISSQIFNLSPIILDDLFDSVYQDGYDVGSSGETV